MPNKIKALRRRLDALRQFFAYAIATVFLIIAIITALIGQDPFKPLVLGLLMGILAQMSDD